MLPKETIPNIQLVMDMNKFIHKLHDNGMCEINGYPTSIKKLFNLPIKDIITYGNLVLRGLLNNNQGCANYHKGSYIQYIVQFSIAKTIARKFDISMKQVFKRMGKLLTHNYTDSKGKVKSIRLAFLRSFKKDKDYVKKLLYKLKEPIQYKYDDTNPLARNCYICGNPHNHYMFHRKKISSIKPPYTPIIKEMIRINRRQLCLCQDCFCKVSNNQLEQNQITKR